VALAGLSLRDRGSTLSFLLVKRLRLWNTRKHYALVDDNDYEWLSRWRFRLDNRGYAYTRFGSVRVHLHALLLRRPMKHRTVCDHRSGNRLDNQRANLRVATYRQNAANARRRRRTTHSIGVRPSRNGKRWVARVGSGGNYLGTFATQELAARARDTAAKKMFGSFAVLNYPDENRD
jgi:hypothetical protein